MKIHQSIMRIGFAGLLACAATYARAAAPFAATQPATQISSSSATLNGMAVPNGEPSVAWFEWGTNTSYGHLTTPTDVGSGSSVVRVSASIGSLTSREVFVFRLVVSNATAILPGPQQSFATGKKLAAWGDNSFGQVSVPNGYTQAVAVACGFYHSLSLDTDGKVAVWGYNAFNQTNVPTTLSNVVAVAGGWLHSLALQANGVVVGWGNNSYTQAVAPSSLTTAIAIAAGNSHSVALKADGTVVAWGDNFFGQLGVPGGLNNVVAIACGDNHTLALKADGTVVAWGDNIFGQATVPAGLSGVTSIAAGSGLSIALKSDGTVVTWGYPVTLPGGLTGNVGVAAGWVHYLALKSDRTLTGWGSDTANIYTPPPGLVNVASLSAGGRHNLMISDNTPPIATGATNSGPLNLDLVLSLAGFDPNGDALNFRIVTLPAAGSLFQYDNGARGAAITAADTPVTDTQGRVIFVPQPHAFGNLYTTFTFLTADAEFNSPAATQGIIIIPTKAATRPATDLTTNSATLNGAILANGEPTTAWFEWGPLGAYGNSTAPVNVGAGTSLTRTSAGINGLAQSGSYQCRLVVSNAAVGVLTGARQVFTTGWRVGAWGSSTSGQTNFPAGTSNVVAVAASGSHNLALRAGGKVLSWGLNTSGQTNVPATLSNVVAIAAGGSHSLALQTDGKVIAWGRNTSGQTNVPATLSNVVAIAAGGTHSVAARRDGSVVAWGDNTGGQTNVPFTAANTVAVAAGLSNSYALKVDGTITVWGGSAGGVMTVPAAASNVIAIAAGAAHSLAIKADGTAVAWGANSSGQITVPAGLYGTVAAAGGDAHSLIIGNVPPTANAQTLAGFVNHDLVVALAGSDVNKDTLGFRVLSAPLQGTLYQYNAGSRGPAISSGNGFVTDSQGRIIFAPAGGSLGSYYALYAANDGATDSVPALLTFNLALPAMPTLTSFGPGNGAFNLNFSGSANATYSVWGSTNLQAWDYLGTAGTVGAGAYQFADTGATNLPMRFYRVTAP